MIVNRAEDPNSTATKVMAAVVALVAAIALLYFMRTGSDESWQPFQFDYDAHKETRMYDRGPKGYTDISNKEIDAEDYETLAAMAEHDLSLRGLIKEVMRDDRVTRSEWNLVIDANEKSWEKWRKADREGAKERVKAAAR